MKRLICGVLILFVLLCAACACNQEFQFLLNDVNALHKEQMEMAPKESILAFLPVLPRTGLGFTEDELELLTENLNTSVNPTNKLTLEQAEQDIDLLFRVLRYCYGPYIYFGGDEAFDEAKALILSDMRTLESPFQIGALTASFQERLSFIKDAHFCFNRKPIIPLYGYYCTEELAFSRDEAGYFTLINKEKQYVKAVNGSSDVDEVMKLLIDPSGRLVYYIGALSPVEQRRLQASVALENETRELTLVEAVPGVTYGANLPYSEDWDSRVPIVACTEYTVQEAFDSFVKAAKRLREEPVAILDLRGNKGGDAEAIRLWLKAYDPDGIAKNYYGRGCFYLTSKAPSYLSARSLSLYPYVSWVQNDLYNALMYQYRYDTRGYDLIKENAALRFCEAENLLFVLMDSHTFSGGEHLLAALRGRENVIFVGTNSGGMLIGGAGQQIVLSNSKNHFAFGGALLLWYDESAFQEGRGFLPDIWVGGDALERVRELIRYYR